MSEYQVVAWLGFVIAAMFTGFVSGFYIGYDKAIETRREDPKNQEWYRWPRITIKLDDHLGDYQLAREVSYWIKENVNKLDYRMYVNDDEALTTYPHCVFHIKDRNIALTLSIKYNILYTPGYGKGYQ